MARKGGPVNPEVLREPHPRDTYNQIQAVNGPQRVWEPQRVWDRL